MSSLTISFFAALKDSFVFHFGLLYEVFFFFKYGDCILIPLVIDLVVCLSLQTSFVLMGFFYSVLFCHSVKCIHYSVLDDLDWHFVVIKIMLFLYSLFCYFCNYFSSIDRFSKLVLTHFLSLF
jgi:hypothetical protein